MLFGALYKFSSKFGILNRNNIFLKKSHKHLKSKQSCLLLVMGIIPVAPIDWVGLISSKVPIEHNQVVMFNKDWEMKIEKLRKWHEENIVRINRLMCTSRMHVCD